MRNFVHTVQWTADNVNWQQIVCRRCICCFLWFPMCFMNSSHIFTRLLNCFETWLQSHNAVVFTQWSFWSLKFRFEVSTEEQKADLYAILWGAGVHLEPCKLSVYWSSEDPFGVYPSSISRYGHWPNVAASRKLVLFAHWKLITDGPKRKHNFQQKRIMPRRPNTKQYI